MGKKPNVCLIWLDTLRWDYAEHIEAFAQVMDKGFFFERIWGPGTFTSVVMASVRSGMYPPRHGARAWAGKKGKGWRVYGRFKEEKIKTLSQFLEDHHAVKKLSIARPGPKSWAIINDKDRFREAVAKKSPTFFPAHCAWLHASALKALGGWRKHMKGLPSEKYAALMPKVSRFVAAIFDRYQEFGLFDDTIFVIMGDHGIGIEGDRHPVGAGYIHDARTRVPCLIFGPGIEPKRIKGPNSLIDIFPTILEALDIPCVPPEGMLQPQGFSAFQEIKDRFVYIEAQSPNSKWPSNWPNVFGATDGRIKVMITPDGIEAYDLEEDPKEKNNKPELAKTDRGQDLLDFTRQIKSEGDPE
jgi:arylsulfatase A-like enzyme